MALVNVYIKDPAVTQVKRDQKVPLIWFVANIGGILGLTMGMSLVTFFEILHHIIMLFFKTGAKSLATVRRTMTVTSLMRNPQNTVNTQEIQNTDHVLDTNIEEEVEIREVRIQPMNSMNHGIISHESGMNGLSKKRCMTLYVTDNSKSIEES